MNKKFALVLFRGDDGDDKISLFCCEERENQLKQEYGSEHIIHVRRIDRTSLHCGLGCVHEVKGK